MKPFTIEDLPKRLQVEGVIINNGQKITFKLTEAQIEALAEINLPLMNRRNEHGTNQS